MWQRANKRDKGQGKWTEKKTQKIEMTHGYKHDCLEL